MSGHAEREWRQAALLDDPEWVESTLIFHRLRGDRYWCVPCGPRVLWPCVPWRVATLARMRQARASEPISWFGDRSPSSADGEQ